MGKQEAQFSDVAPEAAEWESFRKPMWESLGVNGVVTGLAGGPFDFSQSYAKQNGNRLFLGSFWNGYGFTQNATFDDANSNTAGAINTPATTYTSIVDAIYLPVKAQQGKKVDTLREWSTSLLTNYTFQKGRLKGFSIGGSYRWQDEAVAGYESLLDPSTYARPNATTAQIVFPDLTKPIFIPSIDALDLWASYYMKIYKGKVGLKIQINVRDVMEDGGLQTLVFNQDGSPAQYRIVDPRTWFITTTFDF
jgi:hypothetical protein